MSHLKALVMFFVAIMWLNAPVLLPSDTYQFGPASFKTEMWINNKAVFKKPAGVDVEFVTAGPFDWVIADSTGHEVKTVRHKNEHGGWD